MMRDFTKNKKTLLQQQERVFSGKRYPKNQDRVLYSHIFSTSDHKNPVITPREEAELRTFFAKILLLLFAGVMILISIIGDYGLLETATLKKKETQLTLQIQSLQLRKEQMIKEIDALQNSPEYIEVLARKELGLVRPEEQIYYFPLQSNPHK